MASPNLLKPVLTALEAYGAKLTDEQKATWEKFIEPMADDDANKLVTAAAQHIQMNGLAGMVAPAFRNAIIGAEPTLDGIINDSTNKLFDSIENTLDTLAKS